VVGAVPVPEPTTVVPPLAAVFVPTVVPGYS